jgi:hypothetical protein
LYACENSPLYRYADPDADHREDYDGPPVNERAQRRFHKRFMESNVASTGVEGVEAEAQEITLAGGVVVQDLTPTEIDSGHFALREGLVQNFDVLWKKRKVHWLKYPKSHRK